MTPQRSSQPPPSSPKTRTSSTLSFQSPAPSSSRKFTFDDDISAPPPSTSSADVNSSPPPAVKPTIQTSPQPTVQPTPSPVQPSPTRGSLHKKPPVPKKPAGSTAQGGEPSFPDLPPVSAPFALVFDDDKSKEKAADPFVVETRDSTKDAGSDDAEPEKFQVEEPTPAKERDILDEIDEERAATTSTSLSGKSRPPTTLKPSHLKAAAAAATAAAIKSSGSGAAGIPDPDWLNDDDEGDFAGGDDLVITQKPKRSSDMADARVVVDRIFNEEADVAWVLLKFEKDSTVVVHNHGTGGVDELVENFDDTLVLFGYLRTFVGYASLLTLFFLPLNIDNPSYSAEHRTKFVFIRWVGELITPMARAKAVDNKNVIVDEYLQVHCPLSSLSAVKKKTLFSDSFFFLFFFSSKFFHLELLANERDEVTGAIVKDRLKRAGGANYDPKQNEGH